MTQHEITCPSCHQRFDIVRHHAVRIAAGGFGLLIGGAITQSLLGAIAIGAISYGVMAYVDERRARRCPSCENIAWRAARERPEEPVQAAPVTPSPTEEIRTAPEPEPAPAATH